MALCWDIRKIKQQDSVCWQPADEDGEQRMTARCEILIWATMALDLGSLTAKNVDEWLVRFRMYEQAFGPLGKITEPDAEGKLATTPWRPTRQELERFVGLSTNVATKSRAAFRTRMAKNIETDAVRAVKRADREATGEQAA